MLGKLCDNEHAALGARWAGKSRCVAAIFGAVAPRTPFTLAMLRALLQLAVLFLLVAMLVGALIATMLGWDIHNILRDFDAITTSLGAFARWLPMALAINWAWSVTA